MLIDSDASGLAKAHQDLGGGRPQYLRDHGRCQRCRNLGSGASGSRPA